MKCKECEKEIEENRFCQHCGFEQYTIMKSLQEINVFEKELEAFIDNTHNTIMEQLLKTNKVKDPSNLMSLTDNVKFVLSTMRVTIDWVKGSGRNPLHDVKEMHENAIKIIFED